MAAAQIFELICAAAEAGPGLLRRFAAEACIPHGRAADPRKGKSSTHY
jgi:hypothetical protein